MKEKMAKNNPHNNNTEEPKPDRWYNITLGSSFKDTHSPSSKFCTFRYEFKPASIDKSQSGTLHKGKDNLVTVEYHNNQQGKPKVTFEGVSEDYKENDAVLFFDGESFRLERLHRAVKRLRHLRLPGESAAAASSVVGAGAGAGAVAANAPLPAASVVPAVESYSGSGGKGGPGRPGVSKGLVPPVPVQVEQIDVGGLESLGAESKDEKHMENSLVPPNPSSMSPDFSRYDSDENIDIVDDDNQVDETANIGGASEKGLHTGLDIDINLPHQVDADEEIADVDISDDEAERGPNAAEALRAQVNAEGRIEKCSSSSSSSGSDSSGSENGSGSGSGSGSSSSDSESSDGDSVTSV